MLHCRLRGRRFRSRRFLGGRLLFRFPVVNDLVAAERAVKRFHPSVRSDVPVPIHIAFIINDNAVMPGRCDVFFQTVCVFYSVLL